MYVKRLAIVYVCGRFSYLCTFVEPAIFVYIREPFSFGPTFGEDFGFDAMFLLVYVERLVFVYICGGFSYLCVFVKVDCVLVFGLMYLCMLNGSYSCTFGKSVHICVCVCV